MFFWILIFDPNWPFCKGYTLCMMADFQNRLISGIFCVFSSGFLQQNNSNMIKESFFRMFFWILIFDRNWLFCKGYSLCMMADFQNRLISRIFGVFSSGLLQRTTLTWLKNLLSHVFLNFNFWPKLTIFQRLYPLHDRRFSKSSHFWNILCFLKRFFAQNNSNMIKESFFCMFFWILIFDRNWLFCKGYSLCMMADFQTRLISRIFGVFSSGFLHRTTLTWLKNLLSHVFLNFNFWPKLTILQRL